MPYIERWPDGRIKGVYATPQPQKDGSFLTEPDEVPDDDAEIVEYLSGLNTRGSGS